MNNLLVDYREMDFVVYSLGFEIFSSSVNHSISFILVSFLLFLEIVCIYIKAYRLTGYNLYIELHVPGYKNVILKTIS